MRLLVVEDDERLARNLARALEPEGWAVDVVLDGTSAVAAASTTSYDAIVLDRMLPGLDGLDVIRELRNRRMPTPVLMLTARDSVEDRVEGLDVGADDYLVKPFALKELVARLRAIRRRPASNSGARIEVGPVTVDTAARAVELDGEPIALTAKEFALLEYLVLNRGRTLSSRQILEHVWDASLEGGDNLVEVYIGRVRRKLREGGADGVVETVRGFGYRVKEAE